MSPSLSRGLFTGICLTVAVVAPGAAQCRAADAQTVNMIRYMTVLATAPAADSEHVAKRHNYGIPSTTASKISLVTSGRTCGNALQAFLQAVPGLSPAPTNVYVVSVGSVYVVWSPGPFSGAEYIPHVVMDSKFAVKSKFAT